MATLAADTTVDRLHGLFDELQASAAPCPQNLDRFGVADEAECVAVPGTFKQVRKAFRREFDRELRLLDTWSREAGYRSRVVLGSSEVFSVAYDAGTGILAVVPYRPCPSDPTVRSTTDEGYEPPRLVERVPPDIPAEALEARRDGVAILRLLVREDGQVGEVCAIAVEPPGYGFEQAAVRAVHQWRFEPATVDGTVAAAYSIHLVSWSIGSSQSSSALPATNARTIPLRS